MTGNLMVWVKIKITTLLYYEMFVVMVTIIDMWSGHAPLQPPSYADFVSL